MRNFTGLAGGTGSGPTHDSREVHCAALWWHHHPGAGAGGPGYNFAHEHYPALVFDKPYLLAMEMPERIPTVHCSLKPLRRPRG